MRNSEIKRKTPLKNSGFKPSVAKPAKGKPRQKTCKVCRTKFPANGLAVVCGVPCAIEHGKRTTAAQKVKAARAERAADKVKLEKFKRQPQLVAEAQKVFNLFIRLRDAGKPCICCGRTETSVDGLGAHGWDCGHWRSTGAAPQHRFNEDNAARQLVYCNRNLAGNAVAYRAGLIDRIGIERVEALENDNATRKWTHDELRAIKAHYQAKVREMKKEAA